MNEVTKDTRTLAQIQIDGILANRTNDEILTEIFTLHPENSKKDRPTSKACVNWYRTHLRNDRKTRLFVESTRGWTFDPVARRWSRAEPPAPVEERPDLGF